MVALKLSATRAPKALGELGKLTKERRKETQDKKKQYVIMLRIAEQNESNNYTKKSVDGRNTDG